VGFHKRSRLTSNLVSSLRIDDAECRVMPVRRPGERRGDEHEMNV
jgi:hypothetical protein